MKTIIPIPLPSTKSCQAQTLVIHCVDCPFERQLCDSTTGYRTAKKIFKHLSCIVRNSAQQRWPVLYDQRTK